MHQMHIGASLAVAAFPVAACFQLAVAMRSADPVSQLLTNFPGVCVITKNNTPPVSYPKVTVTSVLGGVPIPQQYWRVSLALGRGFAHPATAAAAGLLLKARLLIDVTHSAAAGALGITLGSGDSQRLMVAARAHAEQSEAVLRLLPEAVRQGERASISSALEAAYGPELGPAADVVPPVVARLVRQGGGVVAGQTGTAGGKRKDRAGSDATEPEGSVTKKQRKAAAAAMRSG